MWGVRNAVVWGAVCIAAALLLHAAVGGAAANAPPMAEAGLDQEAVVNSTVYLDAGGSVDPDGTIASYEWSIDRPNGSVSTPECASCSLTSFVPMRPGQYNVTVTVRDDDGAEMSDTMYVQVEGVFINSDSGDFDGIGGTGSSGGWGGGANSDTVMFNHESGNLWISLDGNGVQLGGATRDPGQAGADYNKWMTKEEVNHLEKMGAAINHGSRLEVFGAVADELLSALETSNALEHQYKDAETFGAADQTADEVIDTSNEQRTKDKYHGNKNDKNSINRESLYTRNKAEGADSIESADQDEQNWKDSDDADDIGPEGCTMGAFCGSAGSY